VPLIGADVLQVVVDRIIVPTPVIAKVVAYLKREEDGTSSIVLHVVSDCGDKDTVVKKLFERAKSDLAEAFDTEPGNVVVAPFRLVQSKTNDDAVKFPKPAQLLYIRRAVV
jgi:hypothetical protein